jgi:ligand-binding sensor protein
VGKLLPGGAPSPAAPLVPVVQSPDADVNVADSLPLSCVQAIQDVFAELADVGAVTTTPTGQPVTSLSNCSRFCQLIQSSRAGRAACIDSWRKLTEEAMPQLHFATCHAGLAYACAHIEVNSKLEAVLVAGQFHATPPNADETRQTVEQLAQRFDLEPALLAEAAAELPVLNRRMQASIGQWLAKVAQTFSQIGKERTALKDRLRLIAAMSSLDPN